MQRLELKRWKDPKQVRHVEMPMRDWALPGRCQHLHRPSRQSGYDFRHLKKRYGLTRRNIQQTFGSPFDTQPYDVHHVFNMHMVALFFSFAEQLNRPFLQSGSNEPVWTVTIVCVTPAIDARWPDHDGGNPFRPGGGFERALANEMHQSVKTRWIAT